MHLRVVINVTTCPTYPHSILLSLLMNVPVFDLWVASYLQWILIFYLLVVYRSVSHRNPDIPSRSVQNLNFSILHLSPFALSFVSNSSNLFKWLDQSSLVIIKMSLIYALINYIPRNISFIFSWKLSGELNTPIGGRLYLYFPHGRIIVHKLLASPLRRIRK